jgi:hypothetical protein
MTKKINLTPSAFKAKNNRVIKPFQYKTQKPLSKEQRVINTRALINKLGLSIISKEDINFNYFMELIKRHPKNKSKIGVGIQAFEIIHNIKDSTNKKMSLIRTDGSNETFAWNEKNWDKSIQSESNKNALLFKAMRTAISPGQIEYKKSQTELICCNCKIANLPYKDYDADHKTISFASIRDAFLNDFKTLRIPDSFDKDADSFIIFKAEDSAFKEDWIWCHDEEYNHPQDYQILCKSCNSFKG